MSTKLHTAQPRLLLLSHLLPDAKGGPAATRAWHWLEVFAADYEIHLACHCTQKFRLDQWRAIADAATHLAVETTPNMQRLRNRMRFLGRAYRSRPRAIASALSDTVDRWTQQRAFDAVFCTSPLTWTVGRHIVCPLRQCDVADMAANTLPGIDTLQAQAVLEADRAFVSTDAEARSLPVRGCPIEVCDPRDLVDRRATDAEPTIRIASELAPAGAVQPATVRRAA